jgi:hypothetical protein
MRPRRNRGTGRGRAPAPRHAVAPEGDDVRLPAQSRGETVEEHSDGDWVVRRITGSATGKTYRCPGCSQEIRPVTPHVVAWSVDAPLLGGEAVDARRHWHTACWDRRSRRR